YHSSRRAVSSCIRLSELVSQRLVKIDRAGNARLLSAIWPYGDGETFRHVERNVYEGPASVRIAFMDEAGSESYIAYPAIRLQRVPWSVDVRWIAPAFAVSAVVVLLTLLAWPAAALWRRRRKRRWSQDSGDRRKYLAIRAVLLVDAVVILTTVVLFIMS